MVIAEPPIPLSKNAEIPAPHRKKLMNAGLVDLEQLFLFEGKLLSASDLAKIAGLSTQEALDIREKGRKHLHDLLTDVAAKQKVEPLELLWKIHWLIGIIPSGEHRQEIIKKEAEALSTITNMLQQVDAETVDRIIILYFHRTLIAPPKEVKTELVELIGISEKFQRVSLLAYELRKMKPTILAIIEAEDPAQHIVILRKVSAQWNKILQILEKRENTLGHNVVIARQAADSLAILDLSEQHFKERVQKTMPQKKLRQSQLTHITAMMNAAVEFRDAYLVTTLANRASKLWFELAQGKPSKMLTDDLLRSLRFARTAIFHSRAQDDANNTVKLLKHISHIIGEFPPDIPESLFEAIMGTMKTFISTAPTLDRPADEETILNFLQHIQRAGSILQPLLHDNEYRKLANLQIEVLQTTLTQFEQLGTDSSAYSIVYRELIQSLLTLVDKSTGEEQRRVIEEAVKYSNELLAEATTKIQPIEQNIAIISDVTSCLSQFPNEDLSDAARQLIAKTSQLNEQLYFETRDPKVRAKLALQLLLAKLSPDSEGLITVPSSSKEFDKLEDFASKALVEHAKIKQKNNALKAGSILVALTLSRIQTATTEEQCQRLMDHALDFADKTFSFMPSPTEITGEEYPFVFLLLRSVNDLVHSLRLVDYPKGEALLKQGEQLAQMMANAATKREDTMNQILALSVAASIAAELATISSLASQRDRLLTRATTQIQKAINASTTTVKPKTVKAIITQYNRIMQTRIATNAEIQAQIRFFAEWNDTLRQISQVLEKADANEITEWLQAYRLLNVEIPSVFMQLSNPSFSLDAAKRKITNLLQEVSRRGSQEQKELAKSLEKRWNYQLGADTIITSGFRLEDAETSFTLADEQFRISLQVEERIEISEKPAEKQHSFPYLRPSIQRDSLIWYETTPILCAVFGDTRLHRWLAIDEPSNDSITIKLWLVTYSKISATYTLEIPTEEPPINGQDSVVIQLSIGKLRFLGQPTKIEHLKDRSILINQIHLEPGQPKPLAIQILLR
jgi:hypothetical protein